MKKPEKKIIENIDPINGVSPKQLHEQCKYLIGTIPASFPLNDHQKQEAINNAVLYTSRQMEAGNVPRYDYQEFKDYLFIVMKNEVRKQFQVLKLHYNNFNNSTLNLDWVNPDDFSDNPDQESAIDNKAKRERLYQAIKQLSERDQEIMADYLNGMKLKYICKKHKANSYIIKRIIRLINQIINPPKTADFSPQIEEKLPQGYKRDILGFEKARLRLIFPDSDFINESELLREYRISRKTLQRKLTPIKRKDERLSGTTISGNYYFKNDIDALNLLPKMIFDRTRYINLTDIKKTYQLPAKINLRDWLKDRNIEPIYSRPVNLGNYSVIAYYYNPQQIEALGLPKKKDKG